MYRVSRFGYSLAIFEGLLGQLIEKCILGTFCHNVRQHFQAYMFAVANDMSIPNTSVGSALAAKKLLQCLRNIGERELTVLVFVKALKKSQNKTRKQSLHSSNCPCQDYQGRAGIVSRECRESREK